MDDITLIRLGVAKALGSKIYCDARKRDILFCEADPDLHAMLTDDPFEVRLMNRESHGA